MRFSVVAMRSELHHRTVYRQINHIEKENRGHCRQRFSEFLGFHGYSPDSDIADEQYHFKAEPVNAEQF